jgi:hypothetical protein
VTGTNAGWNAAERVRVRPTNTSVLFCIATKNIYLNPSLDYSTDEKVVGTWIDGKTLYQRSYTGFTVDESNQSLTWHDIGATVDTLVDVRGVIGNGLPLVAINEGMTSKVTPVVNVNSATSNKNKFCLYSSPTSAYSGRSYILTLQYTKVTS